VAAGRTLFRQGLAALIAGADGLALAGEAADADEARRVAARELPDLIVLDAELPCHEGGCDVVACLRATCGHTAIVVLGEADRAAASEEQAESALREERAHALRQGAAAYLPARADAGELVRLLYTLAAGTLCADSAAADPNSDGAGERAPDAIAGSRADAAGPGRHRITDRERAIVVMIAQGLCNKEIAHRLAISTQTVKNHISRLLEKLELADRTQLAVYGVEHHFEF